MKGKLIIIEGTDCTGKETQTNMLVEKFLKDNIKIEKFSFPNYDSPTGKIIGGPYLGKKHIGNGWFDEGAVNVDAKVASLYYAADFLYNIPKINNLLNSGINVILDRYFYSSFAHQGGKIKDKQKRMEMYKWLEKLELDLLGLPDADIKIFLYMPYDVSSKLRENRKEESDQHESSKEHLILSEEAYKEIVNLYNFKTINCSEGNKPKKIKNINNEIYKYIRANL